MPSDRKKGVKYTKKRKFCGNQHSPGSSTAKKQCTESTVTLHCSAVNQLDDRDSGESIN